MQKSAQTDKEQATRRRSERMQLVLDWGGYSVYDNPYEALQYGTVNNPKYRGWDAWKQWMHEHYIGDSGYEPKTGKIINERLRAFFDKWYPNWSEYYSDEIEVPQTVDDE